MKYLLHFSILVLVTISIRECSPNRYIFTSDAGTLSVKFPGKCETTVTEQDDVTTTKSQLTVGEEVYFFSTSVHENPLVDYADMAEISREAFGRSLNADLVSASETDFQGHISNQAEFILANQEMKISYCVFFIDQIQFQMIYMAPIHSFNENHKDKFFNSFRGKK